MRMASTYSRLDSLTYRDAKAFIERVNNSPRLESIAKSDILIELRSLFNRLNKMGHESPTTLITNPIIR